MKKAILFPGQGVQFSGMGRELYNSYKIVQLLFEEASTSLGYDIKKICFEGKGLESTLFCQPAIFCICFSIYKVFVEKNEVEPSFFCGHSLGEYIAAAAAGVGFLDMLLLVKKRAEFMHAICKKIDGGMVAVLGLSLKEVKELIEGIEDVWISNINSPAQIVISGREASLKKAQERIEKYGKCVRLDVEGPFHTPLMEEAKRNLSAYMKTIRLPELRIPLVANFDARPWKQNIDVPLLLQLTLPVKWQHCVEYMIKEGVEEFLEISPRPLLSKILKRIDDKIRCISICGDLINE